MYVQKMRHQMFYKAQREKLNPDIFMSYDVCAYNGGHPFEIYPYICLYVRRKIDGLYLELADMDVSNVFYLEKMLKMFIALRQASIPVELQCRDCFLKYWQNYNLKSR